MIKNISGGLLILLGLFMLLGFFNADMDGGFLVATMTFLIAVLLPIAGGLALIYSGYAGKQQQEKRKRNLRDQVLHSEILKYAKRQSGKLTATEVAGQFALPSEDAVAVLDDLVVRGVAEVQVSDAGVIVYAFHEAKNNDSKDSAKGVLDV